LTKATPVSGGKMTFDRQCMPSRLLPHVTRHEVVSFSADRVCYFALLLHRADIVASRKTAREVFLTMRESVSA